MREFDSKEHADGAKQGTTYTKEFRHNKSYIYMEFPVKPDPDSRRLSLSCVFI